MSKWCNNRGRKLIYIITKLTCRRFRLSYILPPPPEIALKRSRGPHGPHQVGPRGDGRGDPGRATGRIGAVRHRELPYVRLRLDAAACRLTVAALLPSCRVSASFRHRPRRPTLRSVARFDHPACRRPGGRRVNTPPSSSLHQGLLVPLTRDHTAPTAADLAAAGPGALPALLVLRPELSSLELPWLP